MPNCARDTSPLGQRRAPHRHGRRRTPAPPVRDLLTHLDRDGWIAEEPEHHLLPHLRAACTDSPFTLNASRTLPDGVFELTLDLAPGPEKIDVLRSAIRLLSAVAEPAFFVRQTTPTTIDCATGVLDGDPPGFASHGHLIRLLIITSPQE